MPDGKSVRLDTLARCVGIGRPSSNDNRKWYRLFDHSSASDDVPDLGALSDTNPEIIRHDYLRGTREQDWTRFSVDKAGTFCVSVNRPAVTVRGNNDGDAQSIPGAARVYRERVSKTAMSLDFANDPASAKTAWLAGSEIVRVELPSGSSPRAFYSDGTDLPLEDTWHLYDGTIDGDNYGGFVGDKRRVVHYATYKAMTDRKFQSQRYVQIDGDEPGDYFARVEHGGSGFSGTGGYVLTISLGKCLPHSMMENGNGRSVPPPQNLRAVQGKGAVELAWDAPDDAEVTGYRIERRPAGGGHSNQQRSVGRDDHTLVEDTGNTETGYTDETAETGVEYEYRVSSRNEDGPGEASEWVGAGPGDDAASEATDRPHGLSAVAENGQVTLTWNAPDDGNAVFHYRILRHRPEQGRAGAAGVRGLHRHSRATAYTDTEVEPGVLYVYQVQAADLFGFLGEASEPTSVRMPESNANSPATGAPVISGNAQVGDTLTADTSAIADEDGRENAAFSYQWLANDAAIQGATNLTYILAEADEGKAIKVRVSFTDDEGNNETLTSAGTGAVAAANIPATGAPTISGTARVGEVLTADTSGISDEDGMENASFTFTWGASGYFRATGAVTEYTIQPDDEGKTVDVTASFIDDKGNREFVDSAPTSVVEARPNNPATGAPTISGTAQVGETLTANTSGIADADGLSNVQYEYQWLADDTEIAGATGLTYTQAAADEGKAIKVEVTFTDDAGNGETLTSAATDAVAAEPQTNSPATGAPTITGTVQVGETLTANTSGIADSEGLSDVQYEYQWLADDAEIAGATSSTYTVAAADEGKAIKVEVTFTDDAGNDETLTSAATEAVSAVPAPNNPATGAPAISGTVQVGETLTANTSGIADADGLSNVQYEYQWLADDSDISGATNATYTLADTDEGKVIKVEVSFTDDEGNAESLTSAATDAVAAGSTPNSPATGAPTISGTASGTAQVGETLTANTSGIADADGLSNVQYEYQWLADDAEIAGATNATYTLAAEDEGKAIKVEVTFTDDAGNGEALTSAATDAVATAEPSEPPDKPKGLDATATHGSVTLTWNDPEDESITGYVILRRVRVNDQGGDFSVLVANTGSAATTYTDDEVAASTTYTYRIKAINEAGTSERSRRVHIDTPAPPVPDQPTGLEATASNGQVVLTWDDPQDDSITGYVILRRIRVNDEGGDFSVLVANTGSAATTYTDDEVAASTTYTYRIKAINEYGASERSRWVHIDTPAAP